MLSRALPTAKRCVRLSTANISISHHIYLDFASASVLLRFCFASGSILLCFYFASTSLLLRFYFASISGLLRFYFASTSLLLRFYFASTSSQFLPDETLQAKEVDGIDPLYWSCHLGFAHNFYLRMVGNLVGRLHHQSVLQPRQEKSLQPARRKEHVAK